MHQYMMKNWVYGLFKIFRYLRLQEFDTLIEDLLEFYREDKTEHELAMMYRSLDIANFGFTTLVNLHMLTIAMVMMCQTKEDFTEDILPFDIVLSDMAPNISGIAERDNALMIELLEKVEFSIKNFLKKGGSTIIKVFQGESLDYSKKFLKFFFEEVKVRKPDSSRPNSNETYILGINLKNK